MRSSWGTSSDIEAHGLADWLRVPDDACEGRADELEGEELLHGEIDEDVFEEFVDGEDVLRCGHLGGLVAAEYLEVS